MKKWIASTALMFAMVLPASAQWTQTEGPGGGTLRTMAASAEIVLGTTDQGDLMRYVNGRWNVLGQLNAVRMIESGGIFLASTSDGKLMRSTNNGDTWDPTGIEGTTLAITAHQDTVFAAAADTIYRSTNYGMNWSPYATLPEHRITTIDSWDSLLVVGGFTSTFTFTVRISSDGGETWSETGTGLPENDAITSVQLVSDTVYASYYQGGVVRSTDGGTTWDKFNNGLDRLVTGDLPVYALTKIGNDLWATTKYSLCRLQDTTWKEIIGNVTEPLLASPFDQWNISRLFVASSDGVRSADLRGENVTTMNSGLMAHYVDDLKQVGGVLIAATHGGIYRSSDNGNVWERTSSLWADRLARNSTTIVAKHEGILTYTPALIRSTDLGATWQQSDSGIDVPLNMLNTIAASDFGIFSGSGLSDGFGSEEVWIDGGLFRSTDNGRSWHPAVTGLPTKQDKNVPVLALAASGMKVVAVTTAGIYYSSDNGEHWQSSQIADFLDPWRTILEGEGDEFYYSDGTKLFYSSNGGATWDRQDLGIVENQSAVLSISIMKGMPLVSVSTVQTPGDSISLRVFRFNGEQWRDISDRFLQKAFIGPMVAIGQTIFGGTFGYSVWKSPAGWVLGDPAGVEPGEAASTLASSRPNPFLSDATIRLAISRGGQARLVISDAMGREIVTLHNGYLAAGSHDFTFKADGLPAGAYFYRLIHGDETTSGTMVKMR